MFAATKVLHADVNSGTRQAERIVDDSNLQQHA